MMDLQWWIVYFAIPLVGVIFGADAAVHAMASGSARRLWKRVEEAEEKTAAVSKELADYKLSASEKFATVSFANAIETRIAGALARIDTKLDKIDERMTRKELRESNT